MRTRKTGTICYEDTFLHRKLFSQCAAIRMIKGM